MYGGSNFNQVSAINISPTIPQTPAVNVQNKSHSNSSGISRAEIDILQSRQKQSDHIDYPRVPDKYMPERPPDGYGVYSEKFIHANLINPTPTSNQVIESVAKDVYEKVMDKISSFLPKKKNNTPNNDDMDEITKGMSELSINKAIAKGISQGIKAVHDNNVSSQHRCSNCYSLGHNSCKCPYPRKRNRKNRNSRSKKRGSVNKVAVDSDSDTNSSDNDSSDNNSDSENSSSEAESESNQVIESVAKDVYEKVMDKISSFLPKKKNNTPNNDDMDEITKGMSELSINKAIAKGISQGIKAVHDNNVSSQHRCSNCYSLGHNSCKCPYPRKRNRKNRNSRSKKRGSVNKVAVDSDSDTNSSDNDSSDNNSDSENSSSEAESDHSFNIHVSKSKKNKQSLKSPIQRSSQKIQKNSGTIVDKQIRKMILDMFNDPDIIETIKNNIFSGASTKGASFTKTSTNNIIPPITNSDFTNYREPVLDIPESEEEEIINDPMEIDFIKRLIIPAATVDPGANFPIMSEDIAKRLKLVIDTKEKHDLRGIATIPTESLRTTRNVAVDFIPGCTICSDFAVVKYPKPMLILPNTLLDKYDYDLLTSKRELKLVCNGKEYFIPINMHKVKSKLEVNCATATRDDKSLVSDQISQEVDSNEGDNEPLEEEWHAPMDFSLESTNSTLKKNA
ncbi:3384_t:CDS:2 [Entrophospora sp. SA101]|nr:3384_t:CDS:2 [Entrophospora sp. SA101]